MCSPTRLYGCVVPCWGWTLVQGNVRFCNSWLVVSYAYLHLHAQLRDRVTQEVGRVARRSADANTEPGGVRPRTEKPEGHPPERGRREENQHR